MKKRQFQVSLESFKTIDHLPNSWTDDDYKQLLMLLDYGDVTTIPPAELKETCFLYLSENEPPEAARIVLHYLFSEKEQLNEGQIDNCSNEMLEEKLWEEYADLSLHESFFNAGQLLYQAYNGNFPHPEAVIFSVMIEAKNEADLTVIIDGKEESVLRLLIQGMPENTLLKRLYKTQMEEGRLEEAENIAWQFTHRKESNTVAAFEIISSKYLFDDLKYAESFEAVLLEED